VGEAKRYASRRNARDLVAGTRNRNAPHQHALHRQLAALAEAARPLKRGVTCPLLL
jgi:hypothetical protein